MVKSYNLLKDRQKKRYFKYIDNYICWLTLMPFILMSRVFVVEKNIKALILV